MQVTACWASKEQKTKQDIALNILEILWPKCFSQNVSCLLNEIKKFCESIQRLKKPCGMLNDIILVQSVVDPSMCRPKAGVGNLHVFNITGRINCAFSLMGRKINELYHKILPLSNWRRVTSLDLLSNYLLIMELRFDAMSYSNLGNKNSNAGHIKCLHRPQVPNSWPPESP